MRDRERRINLKVPDDLHARLKIAAVRRRVSLIEMIEVWLRERLEQEEAEIHER